MGLAALGAALLALGAPTTGVLPVVLARGAEVAPVLQLAGSVDGDIDSNVGESVLDRRRDDVAAELRGAAMSGVEFRFGSGIRMRTLPELKRRRLMGQVFVTSVPDPARGLGTEDHPTNQTPNTIRYQLRLPAGTHAPSAELDVAGAGGIRAIWRPAKRALSFSGLPQGVVRVEFVSAGSVGVDLLALAPRCRHSDRLAGLRASVQGPGGAFTTAIPTAARDRCGTLPPAR